MNHKSGQGLEKIQRLKEMRRDIAERQYRAAMVDVNIADQARANAQAHLDDRRANGARERKDNLDRLFEGEKSRTPVHAHLAVAAYMRTNEEIALARVGRDAAQATLDAAWQVADARRAAYASSEKGNRKIALMRQSIETSRLRSG